MVIIVAVLSLTLCLAVPIFFFLGKVGTASYRNLLLAGTLGWFLSAALLAARNKGGQSRVAPDARSGQMPEDRVS
jgi:hypothetical protein